jgi:hypothetical protein
MIAQMPIATGTFVMIFGFSSSAPRPGQSPFDEDFPLPFAQPARIAAARRPNQAIASADHIRHQLWQQAVAQRRPVLEFFEAFG